MRQQDYTRNRKIAERFPEYKPPNPAKKFEVLWAEFAEAKELAASTPKKWEPYYGEVPVDVMLSEIQKYPWYKIEAPAKPVDRRRRGQRRVDEAAAP